MASGADTDTWTRQTLNGSRPPIAIPYSSSHARVTSTPEGLGIYREIQVIKDYLERFNDRDIAAQCLETVIRIGYLVRKDEYDGCQQIHILEAIATTLDVLRNHNQGPGGLLRKSVLDYVDTINTSHFSAGREADIDADFLVMRIQSAVSSPRQSHNSDTFGGLIYDFSSILLSHVKYNILEAITFLEKSQLEWYTCWQIIKSMLMQHPDFSYVPGSNAGTDLYSVLDMKGALQELELNSQSRDTGNEDVSKTCPLTRLDLLTYCALEAVHQMLPSVASLSCKGYLTLPEAILANGAGAVELHFKAMTILCELQMSTDSLLRSDTRGDRTLNDSGLASAFELRASTSRILSNAKFLSPVTETSSNPPSQYDIVRSKVKNKVTFKENLERAQSLDSDVDEAQLAIIRLDEVLTRSAISLSQKVHRYFREKGLDLLLCPISERPMTDAIYLRCGKTVRQAALQELVAGSIPASHCCCEEIHDDIEHKLHDSPLVSNLAVRHLARALSIEDIVRYGDLPTVQYIFPSIQSEEEKVELLQLAINSKNLPITTFFLEAGVDLNAASNGKAPLMCAASVGSLEIVVTLLDRGAKVSQRDLKRRSALTHAVYRGHQGIIELLFMKMSNISYTVAVSSDSQIAKEDKERCAEAFHDLWQGFQKAGLDQAILYLQRAMELDPENHLYAEEMQTYLDDLDSRQSEGLYATVTDAEGNVYQGFMVNGVRSGAGKLTYTELNSQIESFDGEWVDNVKTSGLLTYRDGSQYHGDVSAENERHGQGILYLPTGAWYEGTWVHNQMHGMSGKYCFENGDIYEGSFENDDLNGHGRLVHANGDYYDGNWKNGVKHGYGIYDLESIGLKYEGHWFNDKKHGMGCIIYPDGRRHEGEFVNDEAKTEESRSPEERRDSAGTRTGNDGESTESIRSEKSGTSASSPNTTKQTHVLEGRLIKHRRSQSFADTVGRRI